MTHNQTSAVIELWKAVIDQALKDGDYEALAALPTDLYMALGMAENELSYDEESGHIMASGCYRSEAAYYD